MNSPARARVLGIDAGSTTLKAVLLDYPERSISRACVIPASASYQRDLARLCAELGRTACQTAATGYGQSFVTSAETTLSEITCHARGVHRLVPEADMLLDIGGQDVKAVKLGQDGRPADFQMNDKCAAGTGRFLEVMARALGVEISRLSELAAQAGQPARLNSMCAVFAESEVITLLATGRDAEDIAAGLLTSIAERAGALVLRLGRPRCLAVTGGGSLQSGLVAAIGRFLGLTPVIPPQAQLAGALGAALAAADSLARVPSD